MIGRAAIPGLWVLALLASPAWAASAVSIEELHVGYGGYYRPGHMTPVFVTLRNDISSPLPTELRITQTDADGDLIRWTTPAALPPKASSTWMVLMCPQPGAIDEGRIRLSVVDSRAQPIVTTDLRKSFTPDGAQLTLEMDSGARVLGVVGTSKGIWQAVENAGANNPMVNTPEPVKVLPVPLKHMPSVWQGLDMIDLLYWDDPRPQDLSVEQQTALAEWVRRGGQLTVALGSHAMELAGPAGELSQLLPVQVLKAGERASDIYALGRYLMGSIYQGQWPASCPMVRVQAKPTARVLARDGQGGTGPPLLCRSVFGAGSVTVLSTTPADCGMTSNPGGTLRQDFNYRALYALAGLATQDTPPDYSNRCDLTRGLGAYLDAASSGGAMVGLVVLLSLAYAALAGPGTWFYLRLKKLTPWSWWAFAAVVLAAILASVLLSHFNLQGASVSQALVVDLEPGSSYGVVRGYFGLYEPAHRDVELSLKDDPNGLLVPMIDAQPASEGFPDVRSYELSGLSPTQVRVPIRRTIKSFAVNCVGDVGGSLSGSLALATPATLDGPREPRLKGTITNDLPVRIVSGVVVYALPGLAREYRAEHFGALDPGASLTYPYLNAPAPQNLLELQRQWAMKNLGLSLGSGRWKAPDADFLPLVGLLSTLQTYEQPEDPNNPTKPNHGNSNVPVLTRDLLGRLDRTPLLWGGPSGGGKAMLIALTGDAQGQFLPARIAFDRGKVKAGGNVVVRCLFDLQAPQGSR